MSESLRDQLKQAGFKEKTPAAKPKNGRGRSGGQSGSDASAHAKPPAGTGKGRNRPTGKPSGNAGAGRHNTPSSRSVAEGGIGHRQDAVSSEQAAIIERRKANKAKIRALIEANRIAEHAGESVFRFTQGSRIKQLFVSEPVRQQLIAGELFITRLNGSTHLVPPAIGEAILTINPEWAMVHPGKPTSDASGSAVDDEYAAYEVPDDLQW